VTDVRYWSGLGAWQPCAASRLRGRCYLAREAMTDSESRHGVDMVVRLRP